MGLFARWNALPLKARYYIGGSTFVMALIGDYVTGRVNDEVVARKEIMNDLNQSSDEKVAQSGELRS